ncbi:MAG: prephenate dehydrogenase/arogenate dehydrogenase family protein [Nitrosopumilus sp.]|nr:prephenate dehydrogenase/arogenate dehydrogenase family protein [Nitrosopumilus sp.]
MGNIFIIGAAGKMGKWFFEYFYNIKYKSNSIENINDLSVGKIFLYDIKEIEYSSSYKDVDIIIANSISESIKLSDVVIFCTPVNEIINIINTNADFFRSRSILIEISSVKSTIHRILSDISTDRDIVTLCIHPMFGPGASTVISTNKIISIPVNKNKSKLEKDIFNKIFPNFNKILIENPEKHDLAISVVISLIYFINLVFSKFLVELSDSKEFKFEDNLMEFFKKISGSTFKIQSLLSESILTDDVSLFLTLFINNDKSIITIKKYHQLFNNLLDKIEKKDQEFIKKYVLSTRNDIKKDIDINRSYEMLYKFLNS